MERKMKKKINKCTVKKNQNQKNTNTSKRELFHFKTSYSSEIF